MLRTLWLSAAILLVGGLYALADYQATQGSGTTFGSDIIGGVHYNKTITYSFSNPTSYVRGTASTATSNVAVSLIGAQGSGVKIYITSAQCGRTDPSQTPLTVQFSDVSGTSATQIVLPGTGGGAASNLPFSTPIVTRANSAFTFLIDLATTSGSVYCNAQGWTGP